MLKQQVQIFSQLSCLVSWREVASPPPPSVVAGSSVGCDCAGKKGQCPIYGVYTRLQTQPSAAIGTYPITRRDQGCGWELVGLSLNRDQGKVSDVRRSAGCTPSHRPPSGLFSSIPERDQLGLQTSRRASTRTRRKRVPVSISPQTSKEYHHR